ncbi:hypothetical protein C8R45DRAFT_935890 [Mycena sanguinolenta]|nr:hypothetical protein C8R45DRAFT_935890 [Mycena sanguinolenta]
MAESAVHSLLPPFLLPILPGDIDHATRHETRAVPLALFRDAARRISAGLARQYPSPGVSSSQQPARIGSFQSLRGEFRIPASRVRLHCAILARAPRFSSAVAMSLPAVRVRTLRVIETRAVLPYILGASEAEHRRTGLYSQYVNYHSLAPFGSAHDFLASISPILVIIVAIAFLGFPLDLDISRPTVTSFASPAQNASPPLRFVLEILLSESIGWRFCMSLIFGNVFPVAMGLAGVIRAHCTHSTAGGSAHMTFVIGLHIGNSFVLLSGLIRADRAGSMANIEAHNIVIRLFLTTSKVQNTEFYGQNVDARESCPAIRANQAR